VLKETIRDIVIFIILLAIASALYYARGIYPSAYLDRGYIAFLAIALLFVFFRSIIEKFVSWQVKEPRSEYKIRRILTIIFYFSVLLVLTGVFIEQTRALLLSYGLVAAAIAVAVQDFFRSFVGGIIILVTGIYRIGDRVEINERYGDVINIGILYTTLMEIKEWVGGDQHTGRLTVMPNSLVLNHPVNNYTKDLRFVFDEIMLPLLYDSNIKKARNLVLDIVKKETATVMTEALEDVERSGEKYYLQEEVVEPAVYLTFTSNWVALHVRYVAKVKERRLMRSKIFTMIFEQFMSSNDIRIASESLNVNITGFPGAGQDKADKDYPPV
jgi:small-conductance mechanosensitive channel